MIRTQADIAAALDALRLADGRLHRVIDAAGEVPLRRSAGGLQGLAGIIVAQQVSKASADAIFSRFTREVETDDAAAILAAPDEAFRRAGLSRPKQRTMLAVAQAVQDGELDFTRVEAASADDAIAELVAVRGIGIWTAECYLLFCAGHPDIFPAGDLALQAALGHAFDHEARPAAAAVALIAERWSPHRSVAARLFWSYYAAVTRRDAAPAPAAE
ncbi:DNA-3-methyladenine glycosylase family protein [Aurantimonas marina]|uniref:DNA-3-methyladenine glycosylase family protein n=1 Tax=Aurantimonas marina TaxID=2780508 RepID=UPI0019D13F2C|nr:DNA-3-methyladenine glycosylase 2 family protein [Aurantimonas marina]